jgi:hypothetical protein
MKILVKKTAIAAILAVFALFLVTCVGEAPGDSGEDVQYTDVVYSPDGRSITLYLDGASVPVTPQQRALTLDLAKMSHDYFEAVFVSGATIARASWEIGQAAGIRGVARGGTAGINYAAVTGGDAAVIFVGKKSTKTLLGIGHVVQVDRGLTTEGTTSILPGSVSVTFAVYPLTTEIGFADPPPGVLNGSNGTFMTSTGDTTTPYATVSSTNTLGSNTTLRGGAVFPVFQLPKATADGVTIAATYTIGGLAGTLTPAPPYPGVVKPDLNDAAMVIKPASATVGLECMTRWPSYVVGGQTYDAIEAVIDTKTKVTASNNQTDATALVTTFDIVFTQKKDSTGIFAWTFQVPVYAITRADSTNGGPAYTRWYIMPGFGPYQYLLDNGKDAGGTVLMGTDVGSLDWLEIFTIGVGWSN